MIEESYVSFDTAKMLKEAGFRGLTKTHYSNSGQVWETAMPADYNDDFNCNTCNRPTQALAAKWLRETHAIDIVIGVGDARFYYVRLYQRSYLVDMNTIFKPTYEEALEAGLREAIKLIKK